MSNNLIDQIVTPYKETTKFGLVTKILKNDRYIIQTESGQSLNVSASSKWGLNSYVVVQNDRIIGAYNKTKKSTSIQV